MPASEAQIRANQANAARSKGPVTPEGKEKFRANAYKHGLTATVVVPEREASEVARRFTAFCAELNPSGEIGRSLALHAARMSVRMEVCADHETAMSTERVRNALAEIEYPDGVTEAEAIKIRAEVSNRAMFDTSKKAILARQYEASAVRGFFRALKELRLVEKLAKAAEPVVVAVPSREGLASFSQIEQRAAELEVKYVELNRLVDLIGLMPAIPTRKPAEPGVSHVAFAIGKPR